MAVIAVDPETPVGALIVQLAGDAQRVKALAKRIVDAAGTTAQDPTTDWTRLEGGDFGAPSGKGEDVFGACNAILIALTTGDAGTAINRLDRGA